MGLSYNVSMVRTVISVERRKFSQFRVFGRLRSKTLVIPYQSIQKV